MIKGTTKVPYGLPLMYDAYIACVMWAATNDEIVQGFLEEHGYKELHQKLLEKNETLFAQWCDWVTVNVWGEYESRH